MADPTSRHSHAMGSLVVFSPDVRRSAAFCSVVLGAEAMPEPSGDIRVVSDREEVSIHSMSVKSAADIETSTPPVPREGAAIKPVFDVESLERALDAVRETGGGVVT